MALHLRSKQLDGGVAKLPKPEQIMHGEIAINYLADHETLSIKNSRDEVVALKFGCCDKLSKEIETLEQTIEALMEKANQMQTELTRLDTKTDKFVTRGEWLDNNKVLRLFYMDNTSFDVRMTDAPKVQVTITYDKATMKVSPSDTPNVGERVTITHTPPQGKRFVKYTDNVSGDILTPTYTFTINENRTINAVYEDIPQMGSIWSGFKKADRGDDYATEANLVLDQTNLERAPEFLENKALVGREFGFWIFGISKTLQPTISEVQLEANGGFYKMSKDSYEIIDGGDKWIISDRAYERTSSPVRIKLIK